MSGEPQGNSLCCLMSLSQLHLAAHVWLVPWQLWQVSLGPQHLGLGLGGAQPLETSSHLKAQVQLALRGTPPGFVLTVRE